ncbi:Clp protease N-terminal domain-containing protein, partial [Streptomyces sp. NPDC002454]
MSLSSFGSLGGPDPFSDLLNRFFGMSPGTAPPAVQRVPIGRLLSDSARELLATASARAEKDGSPDLDTEHLLWAATRTEPTRSLIEAAGADPEALGREVSEALPGESAAASAEPGLTPAAKRVLIGAHTRSQAAGSSYIGPEHVLGALLEDRDSGAAQALARHVPDAGRLRRAADAPARGGGAPGPGSPSPARRAER